MNATELRVKVYLVLTSWPVMLTLTYGGVATFLMASLDVVAVIAGMACVVLGAGLMACRCVVEARILEAHARAKEPHDAR